MFPLGTEIENTTVKIPSTNKKYEKMLTEWIKLQLYKERERPTGPQRKPVC